MGHSLVWWDQEVSVWLQAARARWYSVDTSAWAMSTITLLNSHCRTAQNAFPECLT